MKELSRNQEERRNEEDARTKEEIQYRLEARHVATLGINIKLAAPCYLDSYKIGRRNKNDGGGKTISE